MYGLLGKLTAKSGRRDELARLLLEAADLLRDVPGCRHWVVHEPVDAPDDVWISEVWDSQDDHDASLARPEIRAVILRAMPLLAGPPQGGVTTRVLGGVGA